MILFSSRIGCTAAIVILSEVFAIPNFLHLVQRLADFVLFVRILLFFDGIPKWYLDFERKQKVEHLKNLIF